MLFKSSLALVAAAAAVSASPVMPRSDDTIKVPLTHVASVTSMSNIVANGKARIGQINSGSPMAKRATDATSSGTVTNEDVTYVAPITIGGKTWQLIVDTGCKWL